MFVFEVKIDSFCPQISNIKRLALFGIKNLIYYYYGFVRKTSNAQSAICATDLQDKNINKAIYDGRTRHAPLLGIEQ